MLLGHFLGAMTQPTILDDACMHGTPVHPRTLTMTGLLMLLVVVAIQSMSGRSLSLLLLSFTGVEGALTETGPQHRDQMRHLARVICAHVPFYHARSRHPI